MMTRPRVEKGTVLLLGATGFIGRHLLSSLLQAGYTVTCGLREKKKLPGCGSVEVDYLRDHAESDWLPRLVDIDIVINVIGILRENREGSFQALHVAAPSALFSAAARSGVKKVVQISALGADEHASSRYHRSKREADEKLAALQIPWVIVQPSLIFGERGRSATLFTTLAALPLVPLPGNGQQYIQPMHLDDLTAVVIRLLDTREFDGKRIAAVGPNPLTLREFLGVLRERMGLGRARYLAIPLLFVRAAAVIGDKCPQLLLDRETLGMLMRGNVASPATVTAILGRPPRPVESFLTGSSARAAANDARLSWLLPLLRVTIGIVWILTGIVSLGLYPVAESYDLLARLGLRDAPATVALYGAATLDLILGLGVFVLKCRQWLWRAQMLLIIAYTILISIYLPEYWLHPFGPLSKNLPMLAAILLLHEFDRPDSLSGGR